ncbi:MAG TPA: cytochrome b N-terminal domain-containing protein, partial [Mycobacterium sp.]|nr:cytochrome b N-terminal domain-containing protein [Mycobacterium sp.]
MVHLMLIFRQKHTQFREPHRSEYNVVGSPMFARYAFKSQGMFLVVTGVIALLGGLVQINPIWRYGPYEAFKVSYAAQPDWYMGWIEGAMRIMPSWEFAGFGHTIPFELFIPTVVMPVFTYVGIVCWPWAWNKITGDRLPHHILERPRDRPGRTGFGAAMVAFYGIMLMAAGDDLIAHFFRVPLQTVLWSFRVGIIVAPIVVGLAAYRLAKDLRDGVVHSETVVLTDGHFLPEPPELEDEEEQAPIEVPAFVLPGPAPSSHMRVLETRQSPDGHDGGSGARLVRSAAVVAPLVAGVAARRVYRAIRNARLADKESAAGRR